MGAEGGVCIIEQLGSLDNTLLNPQIAAMQQMGTGGQPAPSWRPSHRLPRAQDTGAGVSRGKWQSSM